jgi:hypothetical protein
MPEVTDSTLLAPAPAAAPAAGVGAPASGAVPIPGAGPIPGAVPIPGAGPGRRRRAGHGWYRLVSPVAVGGRITFSVPVDVRRPRDRDHPALIQLRHELLGQLGVTQEGR